MISQRSQTAMVSLTVHTGIVALLLIASNRLAPIVLRPFPPTTTTPLIAPRLATRSGGGGMGHASPAAKGQVPKSAPRAFVMPVAQPKLAMAPTAIDAPPELERHAGPLGDPFSKFGGVSLGPGENGGIGNRGKGGGIGDDEGSGLHATVYRPGNGVTLPILIHRVEPEFSDEARKSKHQGMVQVRIDVDAAGLPRNVRVTQSLGMGLDEKAIEAVSKWRFRPGTRNGKPVAVTALVEVMFHLL